MYPTTPPLSGTVPLVVPNNLEHLSSNPAPSQPPIIPSNDSLSESNSDSGLMEIFLSAVDTLVQFFFRLCCCLSCQNTEPENENTDDIDITSENQKVDDSEVNIHNSSLSTSSVNDEKFSVFDPDNDKFSLELIQLVRFLQTNRAPDAAEYLQQILLKHPGLSAYINVHSSADPQTPIHKHPPAHQPLSPLAQKPTPEVKLETPLSSLTEEKKLFLKARIDALRSIVDRLGLGNLTKSKDQILLIVDQVVDARDTPGGVLHDVDSLDLMLLLINSYKEIAQTYYKKMFIPSLVSVLVTLKSKEINERIRREVDANPQYLVSIAQACKIPKNQQRRWVSLILKGNYTEAVEQALA